MKKTAILVLLLVIAAAAEKTLWKDEMNCLPMIPKEDYSKIMILNTCSDPYKAFEQWLKEFFPTKKPWKDFEERAIEGWTIFELKH